MTLEEAYDLIKFYPIDKIIVSGEPPWNSQYDEVSAQLNYALIRSFEPTTVLEFGTWGGRCTRDILRALLDNKKDFVFKPYEIDGGKRETAQYNISQEFGDKAVIIGKDVSKAKDIPDNIDYLFVDNSHDAWTTEWVFDYLLPKKTKPGALVHFHDLQIGRVDGKLKFLIGESNNWDEMRVMQKLIDEGKLPLKEFFLAWENQFSYQGAVYSGSSAWFIYNP